MQKPLMPATLLYATAGILLLYGGLGLLLYLFQSSLIYFPERRIHTTPHSADLPYEAITYRAEDGTEVSAWFVPAQDARGTILFCHGNAGNISHRLPYIGIFHQLRLHTLLFDYRGFGASQGTPTEQGTYLDARASWKFLVEKKGIPPEKILVFGESLGGAVAAWLAQDQEKGPAGLILQSTFTSLETLASELYPIFPIRLMLRYRYDTIQFLRRARCPVLVIHSTEDEIVPYHHSQRLYQEVSSSKWLMDLRGDHNTGFQISGESYLQGINDFARNCLEERGERPSGEPSGDGIVKR